MAIELYLEKQENMINDIDKEFSKLKLKCTDEEKKIVNLIEGAELVDSNSFVDRFGYKLYTSELSTGCKAALCVMNNPDEVFNLIECGLNARDIIVSLCKNGKIFIEYNNVTFAKYGNNEIEVKLDNFIFTDLDRLNSYIEDERPFQPDMNKKGIRLCIV